MIKDLLVRENLSIKGCLKQLDKVATGVLLVIDEEKRLIGSISDGDIRRGFLSNIKLEDCISDIYNKNPCYITKNTTENNIKKIFFEKKIKLIPVVDEENHIVDKIEWESYFGSKIEVEYNKIDIPVVVMAGGKGTRMSPFTDILPKPLIPINGKSMLENIIEKFKNFGVNDFFLTLNYKGKIIEAYFNSIEKDYNLTNIWEEEFNGTAGCLHLLNNDTFKDNFIVSNCDILVHADYSDVLNFHKEKNALITVISSIQHHQFPYGVIEYKQGGSITGLKEKPEFTFPINTGVYILNKKCLNYIPKDSFFNMTDLIEAIIKDNQNAVTYIVNENDFVDIGQWNEYYQALQQASVR